jgi:hypothetical protein
MRTRHTPISASRRYGSAGGFARWFHIVTLLVLAVSCAGRSRVTTTTADATRTDVNQLWVTPSDLESRDLFYGVGGPDLAPDPADKYELIEVDKSGYSPGYAVRDREGTRWSVKLGIEAQPELVATRVLWAIGYHQPANYLLTGWQFVDKATQPQPIARFRRDQSDQKVVSDWSWYENPFVSTQAFKGLVVANLVLNNWDWKTSNNKIYDVSNPDGSVRRVYVVRDLGASLGKTTFPSFLRWTPMRGMGQGSRNDLEGFEEQGFIKRVDGQRVEFQYRGIHQNLVNLLTVDDVAWTCRLLARLSDQQWNDAFRAAGYEPAQRERYIAKLKSKIGEGLALRGSASN